MVRNDGKSNLLPQLVYQCVLVVHKFLSPSLAKSNSAQVDLTDPVEQLHNVTLT